MAAEEPSTRSYPAFPSWRASARRTRAAAGERSWIDAYEALPPRYRAVITQRKPWKL